MGLNPLAAVAGIFKTVVEAIDELSTSTEEKLMIKSQLMTIQARVVEQAMEMEREQIRAQADIIVAEAQAESWITRSWRPLTMLVFVALIVMIAFGWMDMDALERVPERLWTLLTVGIGGYIGARGIEKVGTNAVAIVAALKTKDEA